MRNIAMLAAATLAATSANACEYKKGEFEQYLRCAKGDDAVRVVSYDTKSGYHIDCIYEFRGPFMPEKLTAITLTSPDGKKEDDQCGNIGSVCERVHPACDKMYERKWKQ